MKCIQSEQEVDKRKLETREKELSKCNDELSKEKESIDLKKDTLDFQIELEAAKKYQSEEKKLQTKYKKLHIKHELFYWCALFYASLMTIIQVIHTPVLLNDTKQFFVGAVGVIRSLFRVAVVFATKTSGVGDKIPQVVIATIIHYLIFGIVFVVVLFGPIAVATIVLIIGAKCYYSDMWDRLSVCFEITCFITLIYATPLLDKIAWINVFVIWLIVHVCYIIVRERINVNEISG